MKWRLIIHDDHSGAALIMTLAVMTILVSLVLTLNARVHLRTDATRWTRDRALLQETATAGIHGAMALLAIDKYQNETDSLADAWADPLALAALIDQMALSIGSLTVVIQDERSRLIVNALVTGPNGQSFDPLQEQIWTRFLMDPDWAEPPSDAKQILLPLKDWMDRNDDDAISGLSGAENGYYQSLTPPVVCRNAPVDHLSELTRIRGFSEAMVYGTDDQDGIGKFVTVHGWNTKTNDYNGRVNINTAPRRVVASLMPMANRPCAEEIIEFRDALVESKDHLRLSKPEWYKEAPNCQNVTINPKTITVVSDLYRIQARVILPPQTVTITAVVQRYQRQETGEWGCRILEWRHY